MMLLTQCSPPAPQNRRSNLHEFLVLLFDFIVMLHSVSSEGYQDPFPIYCSRLSLATLLFVDG